MKSSLDHVRALRVLQGIYSMHRWWRGHIYSRLRVSQSTRRTWWVKNLNRGSAKCIAAGTHNSHLEWRNANHGDIWQRAISESYIEIEIEILVDEENISQSMINESSIIQIHASTDPPSTARFGNIGKCSLRWCYRTHCINLT